MKVIKKFWRKFFRRRSNEQGSAVVIVTLILALLTVYVSTSLTISTTDIVSSNFEVKQKSGYYTAFSKLEQMSKDFSGLFLTSANPTYDGMCQVVVAPPNSLNGFAITTPNVTCAGTNCTPSYSGKDDKNSDIYDLGWVGQTTPYCVIDVCNPTATPMCNFPRVPPRTIRITTGSFNGLEGFARRYREVARTKSQNFGGIDVQISRDFDNILLPLFQFGIFTDSDFELTNPPNWAFGGWVHSNSDFYIVDANNAATFSQLSVDAMGNAVNKPARITVSGHLLGGYVKYATGSVGGQRLRYYNGAAFQNFNFANSNVTTGANTGGLCGGIKPTLDAQAGPCQGGTGESPFVKIGAPKLLLPIQNILGANPIELIKRGLPSDVDATKGSPLVAARYFHRPGIRITMSDYQSQLPRTVLTGQDYSSASGPYGGVQLDGPDPILALGAGAGDVKGIPSTAAANWYYQQNAAGTNPAGKFPIPRGYQPKVLVPTAGAPRETGARVNGARIHGWIKIEVVDANGQTFDMTQEILNLGVTVPYQANTTTFYYNNAMPAAKFPPASLPLTQALVNNVTTQFPDQHSVIHLQRMAIPYMDNAGGAGLDNAPAGHPTPTHADMRTGTIVSFSQKLDDLTDAAGAATTINSSVRFDYYSSMALRGYNTMTPAANNTSLRMYGIEEARPRVYNAFYATSPGVARPLDEPIIDRGGFYTQAENTLFAGANAQLLPAPSNTLMAHKIDFTNAGGAARAGYGMLENANLPKAPNGAVLPVSGSLQSVDYTGGETSWQLVDSAAVPVFHSLIPFPINMYDTREGLPHENNNPSVSANFTNTDPPVNGLGRTAVNKTGIMNLIELDMGNLGRLLNGDFDALFAQMGNTPYVIQRGHALQARDILDNIVKNQDNGWLVYISDRRGDEPVVTGTTTVVTGGKANIFVPGVGTTGQVPIPSAPTSGVANANSIIGDGAYAREDVVFNHGGDPAGLPDTVRNAGVRVGCTGGISDNKDNGKEPQDSNNDCFSSIERAATGYSETAPYSNGIDKLGASYIDQNAGVDFIAGIGTLSEGAVANQRAGNMIAMTQVPTNVIPQLNGGTMTSYKPPVMYNGALAGTTASNRARIQLFRKAVRLVNASTLFPSANGQASIQAFVQAALPSRGNSVLGVSVISENPVYLFGNYNAPAAEIGDITDAYPGINGLPGTQVTGLPTNPGNLNGQVFTTNFQNCHVPSAIIADAVSFLSSPCVGTSRPAWNNGIGGAGWLDVRSFLYPYVAAAYRPPRSTAYRFAAVSGYTPSWNSTFWGSAATHQGDLTAYTSGALNNFPRFLEDWGLQAAGSATVTYSGSLIRVFKSNQANGAFKRIGNGNSASAGNLDYVYSPPDRDWGFDVDFTTPATLPPGSPFLQLIEFQGFQQSTAQK